MQRCLLIVLMIIATTASPGCSWYYAFSQQVGMNKSYSDQYRNDRPTLERLEAGEPD